MLQDRRVVLGATVEMRRDMCRRMIVAANNNDGREHERLHQLHKDAERVARKHRMT